ncbi:hypothetical protein BCR34DRAFT_582551 [Clohesyomyces aquaticus]|uniref:Uncharacterized protein n=1 Tax=Clohesyomyces aquaticus TaxID=1231657 RepID=A0A1Y2A9L5_9PLEO|nr:hypothetical protein BCR34DRAFT_582551 [Clohesyomyces aquaticus]
MLRYRVPMREPALDRVSTHIVVDHGPPWLPGTPRRVTGIYIITGTLEGGLKDAIPRSDVPVQAALAHHGSFIKQTVMISVLIFMKHSNTPTTHVTKSAAARPIAPPQTELLHRHSLQKAPVSVEIDISNATQCHDIHFECLFRSKQSSQDGRTSFHPLNFDLINIKLRVPALP